MQSQRGSQHHENLISGIRTKPVSMLKNQQHLEPYADWLLRYEVLQTDKKRGAKAPLISVTGIIPLTNYHHASA